MKIYNLDNFLRGWFIGNFSPSIFITEDVEVAVKQFKTGELELAHYHKIATEITVVIKGRVSMNEQEFSEGNIVVISPNEVVSFVSITDSTLLVVKLPCALGDKYVV